MTSIGVDGTGRVGAALVVIFCGYIVGFGWLGSYAVLSGSPVAAIALSLFSKGVLSDTETFAMINGSRMGASPASRGMR